MSRLAVALLELIAFYEQASSRAPRLKAVLCNLVNLVSSPARVQAFFLVISYEGQLDLLTILNQPHACPENTTI
jgi:hypothetical protein